MTPPIVELCVDDINGVRIAKEEGADRVELCAALDVGGLTPDHELIQAALPEAPTGGLQIIVRSRAGDFTYNDEEITAMCTSLRTIREMTDQAPIRVGFVVGALTPEGEIDQQAATAFREAAGERPLTFHRAFDGVSDLGAALETLIELGYDRVLTTGGHISVAQVDALAALSTQARGRIQVIASGGVRSSNVAQIVNASRAPEVHMRAPGKNGGTNRAEVRKILAALR